MANKEIYSLAINIGVNGDTESKKKISSLESATEKIEKKFKNLSQLTVSPTSKLKDLTTPVMEKIESRTKKISSTLISPTARLIDNASPNLDKIESKVEKLNRKESKSRITVQDEATKSLSNVESKISSWTKGAAKKVISLGVTGIAAAGGLGIGTSIKTYSEYEKGLSNVKAVTGATESQMKQLDSTAKQLGSTTAWSARHVTQAEELLGQAGFSVDETISALPGLLNLASAGDLDLAAATDIASGTLRAFNLNANQSSHVADVLALSASATNSDVTDLGETMKYVAPVSQALGISLEDTAAASGLLSNANIKGSQAGTVLRQTMARLASPTKEASEIMKKYGINAFDVSGNMKPLSGVVDNLNNSLGSLNSQQRADVISTIFGTESMSGVLALMNQGGKSVSQLSEQLKNANGAAQQMADTKLDNLEGQWIRLKAAVEHTQITLGERLAPYAKEFVNWLTGKMPAITDGIVSGVEYVSKHTEEIKSAAIAITGVAVAIGGLSVVGSIGNSIDGISKFTSLIKGANVAGEAAGIASGLSEVGLIGRMLPALLSPAGIAVTAGVATTAYAVKKYNDLMSESIMKPTEELDVVERAMNAMSGHINKSREELKKDKLIYDDFGEGISDSFKSAAKDASSSLLEIEMNINRLTKSGSVDESGTNSFKNYINEFAYGAINEMKQKQSDIQKEFQKTFNLDGTVDKTEQNVMDSLTEYFETGMNKQMELRDDVYDIFNQAFVDHSKDLDVAMKEIKDKLAEMKALELEYTKADNAREQAVAQNQFQQDASRVSGIQGASELLQKRYEEHNKQLDTISNNYAGSMAYFDSLISSPNATDAQKENWEKGKEEAAKVRDAALEKAYQDWQSDLVTLYSAYPNAKGKIDEEDGHIFSRPELATQGVMSKLEDNHKGLSDIKESGVYALTNSVTGDLDTMYVNVDETTKEIKGIINGSTGEIGAYSDKQKEKLMNLQQEYSTTGASIQDLVSNHAMLNTNTDTVFDKSGQIVGALQNVQVAADKTVTGILNINNNPIEITSNADGTITKMEKVTTATESVPIETTANVDTNASDATSEVNGTTDATAQIPNETQADITSNADEVTNKTTGLLEKLEYIASHPWNAFVNFVKGGSSDYAQTVQDNYDTNRTHLGADGTVEENASGTDYATAGLSTVNERGWELSDRTMPIIGQYNDNPVVNLQRGTKIKSHMNSMSEMQADVRREVANQIPQQKVQVYQPQLAVAGGGNSFNFDMGGININNIADKAAIVKQATQEFAKQFMEVLNNQA